MPSKAEERVSFSSYNNGAEREPIVEQDDFEQLRTLLLEDAHAQLHALKAENLRLQNAQRELLARHQNLAQAHEALLSEKNRLELKHDQLAEKHERLRFKFEDKASLTTVIEPVLADSIERNIVHHGESMAEVISPLMAPAIKKQIHDSRDDMVEALHPIIGQTVKRAVAEAVRKLVKEINQRLDRAFNVQGTWRRVKGRLTGVPESLAVLPEILPFAVENVFLIARKSGLLMAHVSADTHTEADAKAQMVSSMLTALQDFIKDAIAENASDLHEFRHGAGITYVVASPLVFLAASTYGETPRDFSRLLERTLQRIQNSCYLALVNFEGDTMEMETARPFMQKFMQSFETAPKAQEQKVSSSRGAKIAWAALGVFVLVMLAWFIFKSKPETPTSAVLEAITTNLTSNVSSFRLEARLHGEVWMRVFPDAQDTTHSQDFRFFKGEAYAWRATGRLRMRVGNAGETELFLDGRNLGTLGEVQKPVTLIMTRDGIVEKQ